MNLNESKSKITLLRNTREPQVGTLQGVSELPGYQSCLRPHPGDVPRQGGVRAGLPGGPGQGYARHVSVCSTMFVYYVLLCLFHYVHHVSLCFTPIKHGDCLVAAPV